MTAEARDTTVPVIHDYRQRRIRSSVDLVRLVGLLLGLLLLFGFGTSANRTNAGANEDLTRAMHAVPELLVHVLTIVGSIGALALPIAVIIRLIVRGHQRELAEAIAVGALATGIVAGLSYLIDHLPHRALYHALTLMTDSGPTAPLDAYLAAIVTLLVTTSNTADRVWRQWSITAIALYTLSAFAATQASYLALIASILLGVTVAVAARYVAGRTNVRPDGRRIAAALADRGFAIQELTRLAEAPEGQRAYRADTTDERVLHLHVLDRDLIAVGSFYRVYRSIRLRRDVARAPDLSIDRAAERRVALALGAAAQSDAVPPLLAGVPCGADAIVLVYAERDATPFADLGRPATEDEVSSVWSEVEALHRARIAPAGLTARRLRLDAARRPVLPIIEDGALFATDLRISLDRAQLLATSAQLVGAAAAVRIAREHVGESDLVAALSVLQPIALSRETRAWLKQHGSLIDDVRSQMQDQTSAPLPELSRLDRIRPRTVITLVALIVAAWLLVGRLGSLDLATVLRTANWAWVPLVIAASVLTYVAAAIALDAYVREHLPVIRTTLTQLAASFTGFVMPAAVGGIAVNVRYLRKRGLSTAAAGLAIGLNQIVNSVSHIVLLVILAALTGTSADHSLPIPGWVFIALGGVTVLAGAALAHPAVRRWAVTHVVHPVRDALPQLLELLTSPRKLTQALGGALLLNVGYVAALYFAVLAFRGHLSLLAVALVYLAGGAIGSLAPTPGGLGAVEAALSAGLTAAGMPAAAALSAVLLYRIATFWLPVPAGWVCLNWLQRRDVL